MLKGLGYPSNPSGAKSKPWNFISLTSQKPEDVSAARFCYPLIANLSAYDAVTELRLERRKKFGYALNHTVTRDARPICGWAFCISGLPRKTPDAHLAIRKILASASRPERVLPERIPSTGGRDAGVR
jgi:hypothetical protein